MVRRTAGTQGKEDCMDLGKEGLKVNMRRRTAETQGKKD